MKKTVRKTKHPSRTARVLAYTILMRPEPEGGYTVLVPSLPGCITYGKTVAHAQSMAGEAIGLYLESLRARSESAPVEEGSFFSSVTVRA